MARHALLSIRRRLLSMRHALFSMCHALLSMRRILPSIRRALLSIYRGLLWISDGVLPVRRALRLIRRKLERASGAREFVWGILHAMKNDARWMKVLAVRVVVNAVMGGLWFALIGALCIGLTLGLIGTVADYSGAFGANAESGFTGAIIGAKIGASSGIAGIVLFAIAAIRAMPGQLLEPFDVLFGRVICGQALGTIGALTSFVAFELAKTSINHRGFTLNSFDDSKWIIYGAPTLMICGAIAGALSKRDWPKVATLKSR